MAKSSTSGMNPKILVVVLIFLAFAAGYFVARAKYKPQIVELSNMAQEKAKEASEVMMDSNKVMMKDGQVWLVEDGTASLLESDLMFSNGDKVMTDGMVEKADGTEIMMEEGDMMDMSGRVVKGASTSSQ